MAGENRLPEGLQLIHYQWTAGNHSELTDYLKI
jgi:hypothetical protein